MRSYSDYENIKNTAKNAENIVIVGASFIGIECASNLKKTFKNANITVIDAKDFPFELSLGKEIGQAIYQ